MITFQKEQVETFSIWEQEANELILQHYEELVTQKEVMQLKLNLKAYNQLYDKDILEIHTVRDDGKMIGYSMWIINSPIQFSDTLVANSNALFLRSDYRKGILGMKFIKWSIEEIKKRKPSRIFLHVKPFMDFSPILERIGASLFETTYLITE